MEPIRVVLIAAGLASSVIFATLIIRLISNRRRRIYWVHACSDHSGKNTPMVKMMRQIGRKMEIVLACQVKKPGEDSAEKCNRLMQKCDCAVAYVTHEFNNDRMARYECCLALAHRKKLIPLVQEGVKPNWVVPSLGKEQLVFNPGHPDKARHELIQYISACLSAQLTRTFAKYCFLTILCIAISVSLPPVLQPVIGPIAFALYEIARRPSSHE